MRDGNGNILEIGCFTYVGHKRYRIIGFNFTDRKVMLEYNPSMVNLVFFQYESEIIHVKPESIVQEGKFWYV